MTSYSFDLKLSREELNLLRDCVMYHIGKCDVPLSDKFLGQTEYMLARKLGYEDFRVNDSELLLLRKEITPLLMVEKISNGHYIPDDGCRGIRMILKGYTDETICDLMNKINEASL